MAEHRVELVERLEGMSNVTGRGSEGLGHRVNIFIGLGQELVERWIEQANRHGQPVHRAEDALEIAPLHR